VSASGDVKQGAEEGGVVQSSRRMGDYAILNRIHSVHERLVC
jgi:hypothetical protein